LQAVDQHHLRERGGDFESLDQTGEGCPLVEFDLASTAIVTRKTISEARKQLHSNPHRAIYGALPESNMSR
jgi:hypothetical protein